MCCLRVARQPRRVRPTLAVMWPMAVALSLGACAQSKYTDTRSHVAGPPVTPQIAMQLPPRIVIETDGLPTQHPPRMRRDGAADDPAEPFSPNYGPPPTEPPTQALRQATLNEAQAALIIARAITEHEIRANR